VIARPTCMSTRLVCLLLLALPLLAQDLPRNQNEHLVPWKFANGDVLLHEQPVTLYWLAESTDAAEKSALMTSPALIDASVRCIDFEILLPQNRAAIQPLHVSGAAFIVDRQGHVVRAAEKAREVEKMLRDELAARDAVMYQQMSDAGRDARAGNIAEAIALYKKVWDDRCLFPLAGAEARRELKALGVVVEEPKPAKPGATAPPTTTTLPAAPAAPPPAPGESRHGHRH
jgi:hypothetical protein